MERHSTDSISVSEYVIAWYWHGEEWYGMIGKSDGDRNGIGTVQYEAPRPLPGPRLLPERCLEGAI